ncbi:MAG TPA: hypothetical protein VN455_10065 [Methanotrichaceae archaeon]|nr:hypothetical protein [Methanotrichaceae archaeon]
MKFVLSVVMLMIVAGLAAGGDGGAMLEPGEMMEMVGGSEPVSQYQQYYDAGGSDQPGGGPIQFMVSGSEPESLVVNGKSTSFDPNNMPMNSYWIQGTSSWTQYIKCPMYARFKLLAYTQGGTATVREDYPDGTQVKKDFQFYPGYTRQTFTADAVGKHVIGFEINGQMSNAVIVDVTAEGDQDGQQQASGQKTSGYTGQGNIRQGTNSGLGQGQVPEQTKVSDESKPKHVDPGI